MDFLRYMSGGQGGEAAADEIENRDFVCFEDGSCVPRNSLPVGRAHTTTGWSLPPRHHQIYADGTGGPFVAAGIDSLYEPGDYAGDGTGGPAPQGSFGRAAAFAQLIDLMRRNKGARPIARRPPPERRDRGVA